MFSHTRAYFILCLCSIALGLSVSKPLAVLGLFGLFLVWLIDGNIAAKLKAFYTNKTALLISSIFLLALLGLFYTSNFDFALDDIRRKIPLFGIPFLLAGFSPLSKKELRIILTVFIGGVVLATLWSLFVYLGGLNTPILDPRELSRFNSHIRFGLEVALALFFSLYFFQKSRRWSTKISWIIIAGWLLLALYLFNLFTGTLVFMLTVVVLVFMHGLFTPNKKRKVLFLSFCSLLILSVVTFVGVSVNNFYANNDVTDLTEIPFTEAGGTYKKDALSDASVMKENGYFVEKNIAWKEICAAWNAKSSIPFDGQDLKGQELRNTLFRFITSKGQRKDKTSIDLLTKQEISAIENGVPNYLYLNMSPIGIRFHQIIWEYDSYSNGRNINGHSIVMRWEYWKTALHIIQHNLIFGVGTGDVQDAFNLQYEIDQSSLTPQYRLRSHNQYLTYGVSFGLVGLIWFLICLFYPIFKTNLYKNYCYLAFFSIVCFSMLTEDTLETQIGITFFVFFNTLFLFSFGSKKTLNNESN